MALFASITHFFKISALLLLVHPIHISVTEVKYDEKEKELEIMMRVFVDDLELTLQNNLNKPDLDLLAVKDEAALNKLFDDYIQKHFSVSLDNKLQKFKLLGHERESDAFIFYIQVQPVKKWKTIQVRNDVIMETHEDQSNLVHVTVKDKVRSLRLTKDTPADKLTFDNQ